MYDGGDIPCCGELEDHIKHMRVQRYAGALEGFCKFAIAYELAEHELDVVAILYKFGDAEKRGVGYSLLRRRGLIQRRLRQLGFENAH